MAKLNLVTEHGAVSVAVGDAAAVIDVQTQDQGLSSDKPQLVVNKELICADGNIVLSPQYNTYAVPVNKTTTVSFDTTKISGDCSFTMLLNIEGPAQVINLPDNFSWTAANSVQFVGKRVYVADVTYNDTLKAFSGDYIGAAVIPIDMNGIVVSRRNYYSADELVIAEDYCCTDCNDLAPPMLTVDADEAETVWMYYVTVGTAGNVFGSLQFISPVSSGGAFLTINGGTVNRVVFDSVDYGLTVNSGYLHTARIGCDGPTGFVNIAGGTVHEVYTGYSTGVTVNVTGGDTYNLRVEHSDGEFTLSGGTISYLDVEGSYGAWLKIQGNAVVRRLWLMWNDAEISGNARIDTVTTGEDGTVYMSGGTVATFCAGGNWAWTSLEMTGGTVGTLYVATSQSCGAVSVSGGYIGRVQADEEDHPGVFEEPAEPGPFSGCTIGTIATWPMSTPDDNFGVDAVIPSIGDNTTVERFEFLTPYKEGYVYGTVSVGANSIVKLAPSAQAYHSAGVLVFDADPTAQIINLEN